jgi:hypothetical protein
MQLEIFAPDLMERLRFDQDHDKKSLMYAWITSKMGWHTVAYTLISIVRPAVNLKNSRDLLMITLAPGWGSLFRSNLFGGRLLDLFPTVVKPVQDHYRM